MKLNILIVTDNFPPHCGGSGWSTYFLAKSLREKGYTITIVRPNIYTRKSKYDGFDVYNVSCFLGNEFVHTAMKKLIQKLHNDKSFDIIHAQHFRSVLATYSIDIPKIGTVRDHWPIFFSGTWFDIATDSNFVKYNNYFDTLKSVFNGFSIRYKIMSPLIALYMVIRTKKALSALKSMNKIICVSNFIRERLELVVKKEKLFVIPNMIIPHKTIFTKPRRTIIFVGKLSHSKGFHVFADSILNMDYSLYDSVKIFGQDEDMRNLYEPVFKDKGLPVSFVGHLKNNNLLLEEMSNSIIVIPSLWHEPLGRVHLEALSVGAVIISTNTGGTPDIIKNNKNGLIFDGTSDDLSIKLKLVLTDVSLQNKLAKNALDTAVTKFSIEKVLPIYEELYYKTISEFKK